MLPVQYTLRVEVRMRTLMTLITQVGALAAVGYAWLGHEWLTVGWGLHPIIAGVAVAVCLGAPYLARQRQATQLRPLRPEERVDAREVY